MIVRALALPYVDMRTLLADQPELVAGHCFLSILTSCSKDRPDWWLLPIDNPRCLTVFYDDINTRTEHVLRDRGRRTFRQMQSEDAAAIVAFLRLNHDRAAHETLYVNCAQGISRSGAVVTLAQELFGLDAGQLKADNPKIQPNDVQLPLLRRAAGLP